MKKVLAIIMAMVMLLSLGVTAFAEEPTGSITITNATKDKTYTVYKIFDASYDEVVDSISYTISEDSQFYDVFFDADGDPTPDNKYFVLNKNTKEKEVNKAKDVIDSELIKYVTDIINADDASYASVASAVASDETVEFKDLPYGYYVIVSSLGATVTITSNAPDVEVIDKNQTPGMNFQKKVWDAKTNAWADSNTANVGDLVKYQVSFIATNYAGSDQVKYYSIHDTKGDALWVEFGNETDPSYDISVWVDGVKLDRGYYLPVGDIAPTDHTQWEWEFLGDWGTTALDRNNAQWYLEHRGLDEFYIRIPWLKGHSVTGTQTDVYNFEFTTSESLYDSPVEVVVEYWASVEPNADIGGGSNTNLKNEASVKWTCFKDSGTTVTDTVYTEVFGIGLLKTDSANGAALTGAEFELFLDSACTQPLFVIPTDIEGVYVKDDLNALGKIITGEGKLTSREIYAAKLNAYLGTATQKNVVTTPVNGKIVVLGLDKGTYYLRESKAPSGYNSLHTAVSIEAGVGTTEFYVYANSNGVVADVQAEDATYAENMYRITRTVVENSRGFELPSTGGEGTVTLITIGTLLAIGFAVFLITHKKMSVYTD